ncbi:MAG: hypothetical protein K2Q21_01260 [Chitinophagaceae bacterium]|nr:hypothetical protein [Chitinophagaceae bacterium]
MSSKVFPWIRISIFNLFIIATIGVVLRYKIAFSLPFIDQKHLLHAHSHFAFSGWIGQILMSLMIAYLSSKTSESKFAKYKLILLFNLITAYGMLISFAFQGYAFLSIFFSTVSIILSWLFAWMYWKDLNRLDKQTIVSHWFKAALIFNALSSIGAFTLAYMMANKIVHQNWYLLSVYFFLHFQYNGWFFFACMGLLMQKIIHAVVPQKKLKQIFWLFAVACVPAYFLSALWLALPNFAYLLIVLSAMAQLFGWYLLLVMIWKKRKEIEGYLANFSKWLLLLAGFALTIKLALQLGSTLPELSTLAFGFRPIVIAYLHLILLGVISLFVLGFIVSENLIPINRQVILGVIIFTSGIFINEFILMVQGIAAIFQTVTPFANELLFATACILFTGLLFLNLGIKKS